MTARPPRKKPGRSSLSPEEERLWRYVTRDVNPLEGRTPPRVSSPPQRRADTSPARASNPAEFNTSPRPATRASPSPHDSPPNAVPPNALPPNAQWARRMRRGDVAIDARLDLHGLTQQEAHARLIRFVSVALAQKLRVLLIITGKGGRSADGGREKGVLRRNLPHWLKESGVSDRILAITPAHPRHGGAGAFYVALRRQRDKDVKGGTRR